MNATNTPPAFAPPRTRLGGGEPRATIGLDLSRTRCLGEALRDAIPPHQSRDALVEADRHRETGRWTYRALADDARRVQGALQAGGLGAGDRVAVLASNQARWPIAATGAFWAGGVLVPLDYKLDAEGQAALLEHAAPRVLVTEWPVWRTLRAHRARFAATTVWVIDAPEREALDDAQRWEALEGGEPVDVDRERDDVACIVYSSGTGGDIKGCELTHGNYLAQAQSLAELFPMEKGDAYFSILPTNHAIDFMCGYLMPLMFGATVVHQRTLRPEFLRWTMKRYGITHMALVPAILKRLQKRLQDRFDELTGWKRAALEAAMRANEVATLKRPNHALSKWLLKPVHEEFGGNLRLMFAGGAFVEPDCAEFFYRLGLPVVIGYGLTEAGTVLTVNDLEPFRSDTVGRPVEGVELEVRDADAEGVGEVWVRGPTVMRGYYRNPELTAETVVDGWLRTGDRGRVDASGHLRLLGRTRNMIVTPGGKNVYPEDIEAAFDGVDGVEELCVFASGFVWPGVALTDEQLVVAVRFEDDADTDQALAELARRNQRLADYKRVAGWLVAPEEFPRTASMKVKRRQLAEQLRAASHVGDVQEWPA